jgi:D-sedoheptulose 7-phosphate isomerase
LSGFRKDNPLKKLGDINIWINNNSYNYVENIHQILLLSIVDSLKSNKY